MTQRSHFHIVEWQSRNVPKKEMMTKTSVLKGNTPVTEDRQYSKSGGDDRNEKYIDMDIYYFSFTRSSNKQNKPCTIYKLVL